jgi:predicted aspartyl protease
MTSRRYPVQKSGNLFIIKAAIGRANASPSIIQLLIDTGATQTGLSMQFLIDIDCPITAFTPTRSITTGNGVIQVPIVPIPSLNCLGQQVIDFPVLALKLPISRYINGILGMDFLTQFRAVIDIGNGHITLP